MTAAVPQSIALDSRVRLPHLAHWVLLSITLHALLLAWSPRWRVKFEEPPEPPSMTVTLRTLPAAPEPALPLEPKLPPVPQAENPPPAHKPLPQSKAQPAPKRKPVIALAKPAQPAAPAIPALPPEPSQQAAETPAPPLVPPAPKATIPAQKDLSAYIAARRQARGEDYDPTSSEAAHANSNLQSAAPLNYEARKPTPNSGWFRIDRRGYDYAEFTFFGWHENFRQNALQRVEVRKGNNPDIDIAVIRSVINIIRRHEDGDFHWYSRRLGKTLVLSARPRDSAGLEEFMMQEFYDDLHRMR
jgi:hypothetical protein